MANRWILIRHPDKEGDKEGIYLGNTAQISELGVQQIPLITSRLQLLFPDVITCSMFPRAQSLAERISTDLGMSQPFASGLFNEIDKPTFLVGRNRRDPLHEEVMQAIRDEFDNDTVPTHLLRGERIKTRSEVEEEVRKAFNFIENFRSVGHAPEPSTILTVSHAKRIAAFVHWVYRNDGTLKNYYEHADRALKVSTTGITILCREPNRRTGEMQWHITTLNESLHTDIGTEESLRSIIQNVS